MRSTMVWCAALLLPLLLHAQNRNNNWVFGLDMWMSFNNDTLTYLPTSYHPSQRNASMSDTTGNLLLLVDDTGIRDAQFNLLPGADALSLGWAAEASNYLILPKPGNYQRYYVFLNQREDLKRAGYVEVDLGLNGGAGGVIGGTSWYMLNTTAKLAATAHANGSDYWILLHEDGTDAYFAYQLSSSGLGSTPIVSHTGGTFMSSTYPTSTEDYWDPMKFDVLGSRSALVKQGSSSDTVLVEVSHFDNAVGEIHFYARLNNTYTTLISDTIPTSMWSGYRHCVGLDFDKKGQYLYTSQWDTVEFVAHGQWRSQISLLDDDQAQMQYSHLSLNGAGFQFALTDPKGSQLQLGPDGELYERFVLYWSHRVGHFFDIPADLDDQGTTVYCDPQPVPTATETDGFPNMCKRYHDSEPKWLGILEHVHVDELDVWPNPLSSQGVLRMNGNAWPTTLRWHDAMGRCVRNEHARTDGPSVLLDRGSLPCGMYMIEALNNDRVIGRAKVMLE